MSKQPQQQQQQDTAQDVDAVDPAQDEQQPQDVAQEQEQPQDVAQPAQDGEQEQEQPQDGEQDGDGEQPAQDATPADPFATALAALVTARDNGDPATATIPAADIAHAVTAVRSLRGKRRDDVVTALDTRTAQDVRSTRDLSLLDRADAVARAVRDALAQPSATAVVLDPVQHAADVLATVAVLRVALDAAIATALAGLDDEQVTTAQERAANGPATADVALLGLTGSRKPRSPRSPSTPRTTQDGERRAPGSVPAAIIDYLGAHAADGSAVKLGAIAASAGISAGAVRAALDRGTVAGVALVTVRDGDRDVRAARLTATTAQPQEQPAQ